MRDVLPRARADPPPARRGGRKRLDAHGLLVPGRASSRSCSSVEFEEVTVIVQRQIVLRQLSEHNIQLLFDGLAGSRQG